MHDIVKDMLGDRVPLSFQSLVAISAEILLLFIVGLVATWLLRLVFRKLEDLVQTADARLAAVTAEDARRIATLLGVAQTLAILLLWSLMVTIMLSQAGVNIGPILAGAGIVGLALGFGGQYVVRDLIAGFFIILENHVRLGDVVRINGTDGQVERITYRVIVLRDLEGVVHVFPHGQVEKLSNLTKDWSSALLDIGVAYKEHPNRVMDVLRHEATALAADPAWARCGIQPAEILGVDRFGQSEVVIKVRIKTRPAEQWNVRREFLLRVKLAFDREGIEIPFPHRTLYFGADQDALPVRLEWPSGGRPGDGAPTLPPKG